MSGEYENEEMPQSEEEREREMLFKKAIEHGAYVHLNWVRI